MPNDLLTPDEIVRDAVDVLHNNTVFMQHADRQYDASFENKKYRIGDSLRIVLPNRFPLREGTQLNAVDLIEDQVTLQVATQIGVDVSFTDADLAQELTSFSKAVTEPAMKTIASRVDSDGLGLYKEVFNQVGTPGTSPAGLPVYLAAGQKMDEYAAPRNDMRYVCINPAAMAATVGGLAGLFQKSDSIGKQYARGMMGTAAGFEFGMDQNINVHTCGAFAGSVLVNDVVVSGDSTIDMDAFTDVLPNLKAGDVFTIAGVNAVNPETGVDTGSLAMFTVITDLVGAGNAINTITVSPSFISGGAKRTVVALPADGAAVTFIGTASTAYPVNMAHHKNAFALVTADLELPTDAAFAARHSQDGVSMRLWRASNIIDGSFPARFDILYGWKTIRPELACRIIG